MFLALLAAKITMQTFQKAKTMTHSLQKTLDEQTKEAEEIMTSIPSNNEVAPEPV